MSNYPLKLIVLPGMPDDRCLIAAGEEDLLAAWARWRREEELVKAMVPILPAEANKRLIMITGIA